MVIDPVLGNRWEKEVILYGFPSIYHACGKVSHIKENCNQRTNEKSNDQPATAMEETDNPPSVDMVGEKNLNCSIRVLTQS